MNTGNIFNLNDPFDKLVSERLEEHMWGIEFFEEQDESDRFVDEFIRAEKAEID